METELYIVRHSNAVESGRESPEADALRELTEQGRARAREVFRGLSALGVRPDAIWSSPLLRARQTAELAIEVFGDRTRFEERAELAPSRAVAEVAQQVWASDRRSLMLVGHEPSVSELLSHLVSGRAPIRQRFRKCGVAHVRLTVDERRPSGELLGFFPPRVLARIT